jgi:hypothetical protein
VAPPKLSIHGGYSIFLLAFTTCAQQQNYNNWCDDKLETNYLSLLWLLAFLSLSRARGIERDKWLTGELLQDKDANF